MNTDIKTAVSSGDINSLIEVVYGDRMESRMSAVEAIGMIGGRKAARALLTIAGDRERLRPEIRSLALGSLGGLCGKNEYVSILDQFISGENQKVVTAARRLLKEVDPDGFAMHLVEKDCLDYRAISAYGRYREAGAVRLLERFIDERTQNEDVTSTIYWGKVYITAGALGRIGGEEAVRVLQKLDSWCRGRDKESAGSLQKERLAKIRKALEAALGV